MSEKELGLNPGYNKCQSYDQELNLSPLSLLLVYKDNKEPWASLVAQRLKCLPEMQKTWVQSLSQKDPLEKEMATHSSILAWRIPWTEEPGGLQSTGSRRVRYY